MPYKRNITGTLMSEDAVIAVIKDGIIIESNEALLPLYLKRTGNMEGWLASRAIDSHRTNSRLLKKVLRLHTADDAQTALAVNAATLTDCYWFKPENSQACYADIRFQKNDFDMLALRGDPDAFSLPPSRTPELTNTGSFEKCWRRIDGVWWIYKSGNENEYFSELFICRLTEKLKLPVAHYEMDGNYIRTRNFTHGTEWNFEPLSALMDDNEDYNDCFRTIASLSKTAPSNTSHPDTAFLNKTLSDTAFSNTALPDTVFSDSLVQQYLMIIWFDTICYNMDRHTGNLGFLRDKKSGSIVSMAPNYDNNLALISRGYPKDITRKSDGLIRYFRNFLAENSAAHRMYCRMKLPTITKTLIEECLNEVPFEVDREYICNFLLNGQTILRDMISSDVILVKEDISYGLTL